MNITALKKRHSIKFYMAIFLLLTASIVYSLYIFVFIDLSPSYGLNRHTIQSARKMLNSQIGDWKKLRPLRNDELIKKLNAIVFNFCTSPVENIKIANMNDLFTHCNTACGGRSYVLRGLLAVYGLKSTYQSIYNIPHQGNHVAVEVELDHHLAFLDPTFGTYFTNNSIKDTPLSINDIKYRLNAENLSRHVYQATQINDLKYIAMSPIEKVYKQAFYANNLNLSSYIKHESSGSPSSSNILYLSANIYLKKDKYELGCIDAANAVDASSCFLMQTNQLYSKTKPNDYISYNISSLGYLTKQMKVNFLNLFNLKPHQNYVLTMLINNTSQKSAVLNITTIGGGVILSPNSAVVNIQPGLLKYKIYYKATKHAGIISLYPIPGVKWSADLFALNIQRKLHAKVTSL